MIQQNYPLRGYNPIVALDRAGEKTDCQMQVFLVVISELWVRLLWAKHCILHVMKF